MTPTHSTRAPNESLLPLGWSFNPSERPHRMRMVPFAAFALAISTYLAISQAGVLPAWDPIFGTGTEHVLHSSISRAFPIPDAFLGSFAYFIELFLLFPGKNDRWLTRPAYAIASPLMALLLSFASSVLVFLQPTAVHAWCFWCLLLWITALMLAQRSASELLACVQAWVLIRKARKNPWSWLRGDEDTERDNLLISPAEHSGKYPWTEGTRSIWTAPAGVALGSLTLVLAGAFDISEIARITIAFCGVNAIAVSFLFLSEPLRFLRWLYGLSGFLLFSWFLGEPVGTARWIALGLSLGFFVIPFHRGRYRGEYGILTPERARALH